MNNYTKAALILISLFLIVANSSKPDFGRTNAPFDSRCATGSCHPASSATTINGEATLTGVPETFEADRSYNLTIELNATAGSPKRGGFQMTAVDGDDRGIGSFSFSSNNIGIETINNREYIGHRNAKSFDNDKVTYEMSWTAPTDLPSEINFYYAAILANGNGSRTGDLMDSGSIERMLSTSTDNDNDGFNSDVDCDDSNADVNPDSDEIPANNIDDNCNGEIDECNCTADEAPVCGSDNITYGNSCKAMCAGITEFTEGSCPVDEDNDGFNSDVDCDDNNADINPDSDEIPANNIDDNCNGGIDECVCTADAPGVCGSDGNTYNNACEAMCAGITEFTDGPCPMDNDSDGFNSDVDCDDMNPNINPDALEIPDNDTDEDCDGVIEQTASNTLTGRVMIGELGLSNVLIQLSDSSQIMTDSFGNFSLTDVDTSMTLTFIRNDDAANGVSAADLVQIINHVIGKGVFDTELKVLASDADGNGTVSALDLVHLLNVVLGKWETFPNRNSWGFLPTEIRVADVIGSEPINIDAYKVGDVNGSVKI